MVAIEPMTPAEAIDRGWRILETVADPELPTLSVVDLGIVREVQWRDDRYTVVITPTYSGCPAMDAIRADVKSAFAAAGLPCEVTTRLAPPWTTEWIRPEALPKFKALGIAPPRPNEPKVVAFHRPPRGIRCPLCDSAQVEQLTQFSSTACKALYRCLACREPFDYFKPI